MVGGGQISGVLSPRTGGPPSYAKSLEFDQKSPPRLKPIGIHACSDPHLFSGEQRTCISSASCPFPEADISTHSSRLYALECTTIERLTLVATAAVVRGRDVEAPRRSEGAKERDQIALLLAG